MANRDKNTISGSLQKKGFVFDKQRKDHKYYYYCSKSGKKTEIFTKVSHSPKYKTIGDDLISQMSKQCRLSKAEFIDLVDCPLSQESYEEKLRSLKIVL
jgi:hypothetical protein